MTGKWTPGPWRSHEIMPEDDAWGACEIWPQTGDDPVATMVCGVDNARLIAASPIMAEYIIKRSKEGCVEASKILEIIDAAS